MMQMWCGTFWGAKGSSSRVTSRSPVPEMGWPWNFSGAVHNQFFLKRIENHRFSYLGVFNTVDTEKYEGV